MKKLLMRSICLLFGNLLFLNVLEASQDNNSIHKQNTITFKFRTSNIYYTPFHHKIFPLHSVIFNYTIESLNFREDIKDKPELKINFSGSHLLFDKNSFYAIYLFERLTEFINAKNDYTPVDFGQLGFWVNYGTGIDVWRKLPESFPCDLSFDHKTQKNRVYLPGETYDVNFYIASEDISCGSPEIITSTLRLQEQYWLMCDIVKQ